MILPNLKGLVFFVVCIGVHPARAAELAKSDSDLEEIECRDGHRVYGCRCRDHSCAAQFQLEYRGSQDAVLFAKYGTEPAFQFELDLSELVPELARPA